MLHGFLLFHVYLEERLLSFITPAKSKWAHNFRVIQSALFLFLYAWYSRNGRTIIWMTFIKHHAENLHGNNVIKPRQQDIFNLVFVHPRMLAVSIAAWRLSAGRAKKDLHELQSVQI